MGLFERKPAEPTPQDAEAHAHRVLSEVTQKERSLTASEKAILEKAKLGELIADIEGHQKDPNVPPWMH